MSNTVVDYGQAVIDQYEQYQQRGIKPDGLVRRFCYMSFLEQDRWMELPIVNINTTEADLPPRYQSKISLPTGIVLEKHGLYRLSMVLRSLLPYHKTTTTGLLLQYCTELLWEAQIIQPIGPNVELNGTEPSMFPPALFVDTTTTTQNKNDAVIMVPEVNPTLVQQIEHEQQRQLQASSHLDIPPWVTVKNSQLGPQQQTHRNDVVGMLPSRSNNIMNEAENHNQQLQQEPQQPEKQIVTFVVPTATRPNGIKNQYVTYSLNQLFPLIRRDFKREDGKFHASVLLVVCGNTQDDLDDHEAGLWEYYGPEIKEGILEIVATNLDTYPTLHNLPDNYGDPENRLRWRSKQNLDISSSFFAAKGRSEYLMLLEDDTGYRDKFTPTLKAIIQADKRQEATLAPDPTIVSKIVPEMPVDDFREHTFAQVHFGFGYSGLLIHDDDALVYGVLHYVLMDEKPCDLLYRKFRIVCFES